MSVAGSTRDYHSLDTDTVLDELGVDGAGLNHAEAAERYRFHGPNALPQARSTPALIRFLAQFNSALIYFLLAAAAAAALLGHIVDAAVIFVVVLINAIVGFVQEGKAERALGAIRDMIAPHATVLRAGAKETIPVPQVVPGDIILLEAGDRVPADMRLIRTRGLLIDEAPLTGESLPVEKQDSPVATEADLADRLSMAYSGTLVASGQATGVVTGTGLNTQIGRISGLLQGVATVATPLLRQINRFAHRFTLGRVDEFEVEEIFRFPR